MGYLICYAGGNPKKLREYTKSMSTPDLTMQEGGGFVTINNPIFLPDREAEAGHSSAISGYRRFTKD